MGRWPLVAVFLISWYLLLAIVHYFYARPLWLDEQWVFANINGRSLSQLLTQGLLHDQAFPKLYLSAIAHLAESWNYHVLALRAFPLLAMLLAFALWVYMARKELSASAFVLFLLCWTASGPLIYYAAELKQYSMDVLIGALFMLFCSYGEQFKKRSSAIVYGAVLLGLAFSCLVSYAAFFFALVPLYNMLIDIKERKGAIGWAIFYTASLVVAGSIVYQIDLRHADGSRMVTYWGEYMISLESPLEFLRTFQEGCNNLISRWFALKPKWIRMGARVFIGIGFIYLLVRAWRSFKKDGFRFRHIYSVAAGVLLVCFFLSMFKKYPFTVPRMYLFLAPVLLLASAQMFEALKARYRYLYLFAVGVFVLFLLVTAFGIAQDVFSGRLSAEPELWR